METEDDACPVALRSYGDKSPQIGAEVFVDESAIVIGAVRLRDRASVWPGAILRADDETVDIGEGTAVMDMAFAEAPRGKPIVVGPGAIISHSARLHGCTVGGESLVGIGAIVLDGAAIGDRCVIAAGSIVAPGTKVPSDSFVMGVPGKVTRPVTGDELLWLREELKILWAKGARYSSQR